MSNPEEQSAYILRISPSGIDKVKEALNSDEIIIGWSKARGLQNEKLSWDVFFN